jgi:hypothetical protein
MATSDLLRGVYFTERCDVCSGDYPVTLYEIFAEQTLEQTWQAVRPCSSCAQTRSRLIDVVPRAELAALAEAVNAERETNAAQLLAAWSALDQALQAHGLTPTIDPAFAPVLRGATATDQ